MVGLNVASCCIFLPVLHHHRIELLVTVGDAQVVIQQTDGQLLVAYIVVDVRIRGCLHANCHYGFNDIELYFQQFLVGIILVIDSQPVVAAHSQLATVVGDGQLIVCVENGGVDGV